MKIQSNSIITHELVLDETEAFEFTTDRTDKEKNITIVARRVVARTVGNRWSLNVIGKRILKNGKLGATVRVSTWEYARTFRQTTEAEMFAKLSLSVQVTLRDLEVYP